MWDTIQNLFRLPRTTHDGFFRKTEEQKARELAEYRRKSDAAMDELRIELLLANECAEEDIRRADRTERDTG